MQFTKTLSLFAAVAAIAYADSDNSTNCDPQNDNNNDATCPGSQAATGTATGIVVSSPVNTVYTTTDANSRISLITSVDTGVVVSTTYDTNVMTTSLPHSLDTRTSGVQIVQTYTSESVFTTNTLTNSDGSLTTSTGRVTPSASSTSSGDGDDSNGGAAGAGSASSSSSTDSGAFPTAVGKYALGGVAAAALGFAAAL